MKKLAKSNKNRKICGVCGGIAEYLNADPTLIRLAFVLIGMAAGSGIVAYILAALIMPEASEVEDWCLLLHDDIIQISYADLNCDI